MASVFHYFISCSLLAITSSYAAQTSFRPKALILPVTKDASTLQYIARINQQTPLVPLTLTVDLGGQFMWEDCVTNYVSTTYRPARCGSAQCSLAKLTACSTECPGKPASNCNNNTGALMLDNTVTHQATVGDVGSDIITIQSTNGKNPGRVVSIPRFLFVCGALLDGLASGVMGMAGLGRTKISLPYQFSSVFSFPKIFAICLSASTNSPGVVFFGPGAYKFLLNADASTNLQYTPLIKNPVSTASAFIQGDTSTEYFVGVKSIQVNEKDVPVNKTLLKINNTGFGGTKISTVNPYTVLHSSIYKAVIKAFGYSLSAVPRVSSVAPFGLCFNSTFIGSTWLGAGVPSINLVLQNKDVVWRIFGANSMVQVSEDALCLGVVDGGVDVMTSIVLGGYQIDNNLLQFDLTRSRLGFSSLLFGRQTTCGNFNFTLNA
ncbi:probable aspartic proteinase GIP2 [Rutidosis leptorrhynchoides]|uniref:probable aspartic proteinase GIP2 n=1 Tax=Rutidosis leptorrhynchoides TaxID=125765 RepID=UPI003A9906D7